METLKLIMLDDEKEKLSTAFQTVVELLLKKAVGKFHLNEDNTLGLGDKYSIEPMYLDSFPHEIQAESVSDAVFFSSTGSALWNYLANQAFHSVNFSELKNDYFDEFVGHGDDNWEFTTLLIIQILGSFIRKWGDQDKQVFEDACFVINELVSQNRNPTHYQTPEIKASTYSTFMDWAFDRIFE
jgi:hypothetical protein